MQSRPPGKCLPPRPSDPAGAGFELGSTAGEEFSVWKGEQPGGEERTAATTHKAFISLEEEEGGK
jgi:hypothetical protein